MNLLLLVESVSKSRKGIFILLMFSSVVNFRTVFFLKFKFVNFVVGMCCNENVIYIVDVYLGFSYCRFKYFVFDVGHVEFGDGRTKG